ncbi:MAG: NAD-dependent epimerase/dehydratase family protein [Candidatus Micrarchaeota archaeon]
MKILVTGCAGFIGSHLCERLVSDGHSVTGVDNFDGFYPMRHKKNNLKGLLDKKLFSFRRCDIRNEKALKKAFRKGTDTVIHLAAKAGVRPSIENPKAYFDTNTIGTISVLNCARSAGVGNMVYASSSSVYGNGTVPFSESDPAVNPISPYAASKRAGELLCNTYNKLYGLPITCLRYFTVYGPRQRPDLAIHKFTRLICTGRKIQLYGTGRSSRDYTHVKDIIDGTVSAVEKPLGFETINLGRSDPIRLSGLVSIIENKIGKKARIKHMPDQKGDVRDTYANIDKARRLLRYSPKVSIDDGIGSFVQWFRENEKLLCR